MTGTCRVMILLLPMIQNAIDASTDSNCKVEFDSLPKEWPISIVPNNPRDYYLSISLSPQYDIRTCYYVKLNLCKEGDCSCNCTMVSSTFLRYNLSVKATTFSVIVLEQETRCYQFIMGGQKGEIWRSMSVEIPGQKDYETSETEITAYNLSIIQLPQNTEVSTAYQWQLIVIGTSVAVALLAILMCLVCLKTRSNSNSSPGPDSEMGKQNSNSSVSPQEKSEEKCLLIMYANKSRTFKKKVEILHQDLQKWLKCSKYHVILVSDCVGEALDQGNLKFLLDKSDKVLLILPLSGKRTNSNSNFDFLNTIETIFLDASVYPDRYPMTKYVPVRLEKGPCDSSDRKFLRVYILPDHLRDLLRILGCCCADSLLTKESSVSSICKES